MAAAQAIEGKSGSIIVGAGSAGADARVLAPEAGGRDNWLGFRIPVNRPSA